MVKVYQYPQPDYRHDWQIRQEMISDAVYSHGRVKDPIAHVNRKMRRYGRPYRDAYGIAYEAKALHCLAVAIDKVDEQMSAANDWETIAVLRDRVDKEFSALLKLRQDQAT